jgi:nucleotide-binding universal stress UspA family protein
MSDAASPVAKTTTCSVLVPVDGSENSHRALSFLIRLHDRLFPLTVHILHVVIPVIDAPEDSLDWEYVEEREVAAEQALRRAQELLDAASVPHVSKTARGYIGSTIATYAKVNGCDAIVMGTRGMGSSESLLGSIARQVVQFAEVPVTLVK